MKISQLSKKEIEDLLKLGAYGALMDDDKDGEKFCEEDIDKILLSRSTVVRLNSSERNSSFSKASFSITDNRSDIKLDDPNFWQKWAKKAGVDENEICNSLIMDKPRLRRQTNRYKPNCTLFDEISGDESNGSMFDSFKSQSHSNTKGSNSISKTKKKNLKTPPGNLSSEAKDIEIEDSSYKHTQDMDRYDLFKAEKCLLQFGWGRWEHALEKISFKVPMSAKELESLCRTILQYAHRHYSGDDRIYSFIEDLMLPESDSTTMKRHLGYSAPVARGRRGRKGLEEMISAITKKDVVTSENKSSKRNCELSEEVNNIDEEQSDVFTNISTPISANGDNSDNGSEFAALVCPNFRKHIQRTSHKLLHRIQFLYFLNHEIIGLDRAQLILGNSNFRNIPGFPELKLFTYLDSDYLPSWWNTTVDKCLLLGIFKHGWEKYDDIYKDSCFGFVDWFAGCNFPISSDDESEMKNLHQSTTIMPNLQEIKDTLESSDSIQLNTLEKNPEIDKKDEFPTNAELNIRLRKIIGSFQKLWRQKETEKNKMKNNYHLMDSTTAPVENSNHISNDGKTTKWSRREETEFYRAINSFGIEKNTTTDEINWTNFRNVCNLPRKSNESLTEYFKAFYTMCQKICQKYPLLYEESNLIEVENISTERASRCLMKINIISKIRNEIIVHPEIEERIKLCESTNDFPSWWIAGFHDLSILKGISKYGATRTELSIISDSNLEFRQTIIELLKQQQLSNKGGVSTENKIFLNSTKNCSKKISSNTEIPTENIDNCSDDVDASIQFMLDKTDELISEEVFDNLIVDTVNELIDQLNSIKKDTDIEHNEHNTNDVTFDISVLSKIGWPKERILFSRLELIVQTIEKGEWPFAKNQNLLTEERDTPSDLVKGNKDETASLFHASETVKTEPQLTSFKSKRRGRKRTVTQFMPTHQVNEAPQTDLVKMEEHSIQDEPNIQAAYNSWNAALSFSLSNDPALMQKMLQMTPDTNNGNPSSSAPGIESINVNRLPNSNNGLNLSNLFKIKSTANGSTTDTSAWSISQSSTMKTNKNNVRRGRRPKHTGPYEMSRDSKRDTTSGLNMFTNRSLNTGSSNENSNSNPETIIPVINIFNGTLIYDETAPKRKNLENFLIHNANYMPYSVEEEDQKIFNKVAKSRGQETGPLEAMIFTQYMNFMMNTMLASQTPMNIYNSFLLSGESSKNPLPEEQMNASSFYMQQYQDSILSMFGAAAGQSIPGLDLKSLINNEEHSKVNKKRSSSPIRNTGIPAKVKSYSISHLTDDDNTGTPDENKTPAHSNLTTNVGTGDKSEDKLNYLCSTPKVSNNTVSKVSSCESSNKLLTSNQNSDILASYQAYLYSAMLYSDYIASMQQYSLMNNKISNNIPDIFSNFKQPQQNKINDVINSNIQPNVTPTPSIPIELTSSNSKINKRNKVTSFSVESMGIAAVVSSPNKMSTMETSATSHISSQDAVSDDYAVLDLSNR